MNTQENPRAGTVAALHDLWIRAAWVSHRAAQLMETFDAELDEKLDEKLADLGDAFLRLRDISASIRDRHNFGFHSIGLGKPEKPDVP